MTRAGQQAERADRDLLDAIRAVQLPGRPAGRPAQAAGADVAALPVRPGTRLLAGRCLELLDAQFASRNLDEAARWLRERGSGYYTIGSAGHESNAAVAAALRLTDPALLHYRSGAFYLVSAAQGRAARMPGALADRLDRGRQLRRRVGESFDGCGRHQHRLLLRLPGPAAAAAAGLRGQRSRDQCSHPGRVDRRCPSRQTWDTVRARGRG